SAYRISPLESTMPASRQRRLLATNVGRSVPRHNASTRKLWLTPGPNSANTRPRTGPCRAFVHILWCIPRVRSIETVAARVSRLEKFPSLEYARPTDQVHRRYDRERKRCLRWVPPSWSSTTTRRLEPPLGFSWNPSACTVSYSRPYR